MEAGSIRILGIEVPPAMLVRWAGWFAPERAPFLVEAEDPLADPIGMPFSDEVRDTFELYQLLPPNVVLTWLDETTFADLPKSRRAALVRAQVRCRRSLVPSVRAWETLVGAALRQQADGHRFVWWPTLLRPHVAAVLADYVAEGRLPSRHDQVTTETWSAAEQVLPGARRLAGTFPPASGPNCFGAVMAAAGVAGADTVWMQRDPFEDWLAAATRPGGRDDLPGTVLVWRSSDGAVQHAAVTLGGGWVLHKPSQGWMSPTKVLTLQGTLRSARAVGRRVQRRHLTS